MDGTVFSLCTEDHQSDDDCREHGGGQGGTGWVRGGAGILGYRSLHHNGETAGHSAGLGTSLGALNAQSAATVCSLMSQSCASQINRCLCNAR